MTEADMLENHISDLVKQQNRARAQVRTLTSSIKEAKAELSKHRKPAKEAVILDKLRSENKNLRSANATYRRINALLLSENQTLTNTAARLGVSPARAKTLIEDAVNAIAQRIPAEK